MRLQLNMAFVQLAFSALVVSVVSANISLFISGKVGQLQIKATEFFIRKQQKERNTQ